MAQWRSAAIALERIRADEFREANLAVVAAQLDALCLQSVRNNPPGPTSGLIEQQRIFRSNAHR